MGVDGFGQVGLCMADNLEKLVLFIDSHYVVCSLVTRRCQGLISFLFSVSVAYQQLLHSSVIDSLY